MRKTFEVREGNIVDKMIFLENYLELHLKEKREFFVNSSYEMRSLEINLEKLFKTHGFDQENFKMLIEKSKNLIKVTTIL